MIVERWIKTPFGFVGIDEQGTRWSVRGPILGNPMWWLYRDGNRYTPTGHYDDAVSFPTAKAAKAFVTDVKPL